MKSDQREVRGEPDIQAMIPLAHVHAADNLRVLDLPYRLSSWADIALDLYRRVGFHSMREILVYRKDYARTVEEMAQGEPL